MNPTFEVGEIAIAVIDVFLTPLAEHTRYNGEECTILTELTDHMVMDGGHYQMMAVYGVEFRDGMKLLAAPHELRKKKPPQDEDFVNIWAMNKINDLITIKPEILEPELV